MSKKIKVTFHRVYEIEEATILDEQEELFLSDERLKELAIEKAYSYMEEDMDLFLENTRDFVSETTEIIN